MVNNNFGVLEKKLAEFNLLSFNDHNAAMNYIDFFSLRAILPTPFNTPSPDAGIQAKNSLPSASGSTSTPFPPKLDDLCRLHWLCLSRKSVNVLEFGSGYSTLFFLHALDILRMHFLSYVDTTFRHEMPFALFSIEEDQSFLEITKSRIPKEYLPFLDLRYSSVDLQLHDNRLCTFYDNLPNISPDLIYLDGPSQFATTKNINGLSLNSKCRMPMSADILRFEFLLEPGTLIIVDGRGSNVAFLKSYLKRTWAYN